MRPSLNKWLLVGIVPFLVTLLAISLKMATGPYWLGSNSDPSYIYLVNSLYLLDGITPIFVDHPGTTLELLGAAVIKILTLSIPKQDIAVTVFQNPEYYLGGIYMVLLIFYAASLIFAGWYTLQKTKNLLLAVLIQLPSFLYLTLKSYRAHEAVLPIVANVNSETLLITFMNLYVAGLIKLYFDRTDREFLSSSLLCGVVCGAAAATKFTFLPLMIVPVALLPRLAQKLIFFLGSLLTWVCITIPVIPRYGKMFDWLTSLAMHSGFHGSGKTEWIQPAQALQNAGWLVKENPFLLIIGLGWTIVGFHFARRKKAAGTGEESRKALSFLTWLLAGTLGQIAIVVKQPSSHYLTPTIGVLGLLMTWLYLLFGNRLRPDRWVYALICLFIGLNVVFSVQYQRRLYAINQATYEFSKTIFSRYNHCVIAGYYRSSSPQIALDFGDDCFAYKQYSKVMKGLYPSAIFYNRWTRFLHDFDQTVYLQDLMEENECVVFYGPAMEFPKYFHVQEIDAGPQERIYQVTAVTADEAVSHYLVSKKFQNEKNYRAAYWHALKARTFGYPSLDAYINRLRELVERENGI